MFSEEIQLRVRYAETDQMGVVYHGNYAAYYEMGRVESLRKLGLSYKAMEEEDGVIMPVLELNSKFLRPAHYDDLLTIRTNIKQMPSVRIFFDYEIFNEQGELIHTANSVLVFLNRETRRPVRVPPNMVQALTPYFKN